MGIVPGRQLAGCFSRNEIAIGPRDNAFPGPAVALDEPVSMVDVIGSVVISISPYCLRNAEGQAAPPQLISRRTVPDVHGRNSMCITVML